MATKVVMAQLSPTMEEGRLVEWKVDEGAEVAQGDVVAEIETDKANMDIEAMGAGVLRKKLVGEGETVPVGALIGVIGDPDEDISGLLDEASTEAGGAGAEAAGEVEDEEEAEPAAAGTGGGTTSGAAGAARAAEGTGEGGDETETGPDAAADAGPPRRPERAGRDGRIKASPVARKIAAESGLELASLSGSGPAGRIVKADVEEALAERKAAEAVTAARPARLREERVEASQMRKAIARRLVESIGPVPHFFLTVEVDMGRALELRAELNRRLADAAEEGVSKVGVNDLLLKAVAEALARHPEVNASWDGDAIVHHGSVDLGIAVAVEQGLITPVLRDAERKGLLRIARESAELVARARARDLAPEEYQGATFSVSNLGMFGIDEFTAIINPPEAGILAVGRTAEKPVAVDGEVVVRKRMRVTMSCDHRVVDGATGARFLATFRAMLENPLEMVL